MNAEVSTVAQFEVNFYYVYRVFVGLMLSFYSSNHTNCVWTQADIAKITHGICIANHRVDNWQWKSSQPLLLKGH